MLYKWYAPWTPWFILQVPTRRNLRMSELGHSEEDKVKNKMRVDGVTFAGFARGANFAGLLPGGFGCTLYQMSGNRAIVVADLEEVRDMYLDSGIDDEKFKCHGLHDIVAWFSNLCDSEEPENVLGRMCSVKGGFLLPGDCLFIPPCSIVVEKSLLDTNMSLRALNTCITSRTYTLYRLYSTVYPAFLALE